MNYVELLYFVFPQGGDISVHYCWSEIPLRYFFETVERKDDGSVWSDMQIQRVIQLPIAETSSTSTQ